MAHNRKENAMSHLDIIRAWKDEEYRLSLSTAERAQLPDNPAGLIELTDADLGVVAGGEASTLAEIIAGEENLNKWVDGPH
jgi:mersacidin/lichenicidin family type 2 lantibiotic